MEYYEVIEWYLFTKRAITKTNIDVSVLTGYIGLRSREGERGGVGGGGKKGERPGRDEGENEREEEERKKPRETVHNRRTVFIFFSGR